MIKVKDETEEKYKLFTEGGQKEGTLSVITNKKEEKLITLQDTEGHVVDFLDMDLTKAKEYAKLILEL